MNDELVPPADAPFRLGGIKKIHFPHPYCIGTKHIEIAGDYHSGILNESALEDAEKRGVMCETCKKIAKDNYRYYKVLSYTEHKTETVLVVVLRNDRPNDLNDIPGLGQWLSTIKEKAEGFGVTGFLFPRESEYNGSL